MTLENSMTPTMPTSIGPSATATARGRASRAGVIDQDLDLQTSRAVAMRSVPPSHCFRVQSRVTRVAVQAARAPVALRHWIRRVARAQAVARLVAMLSAWLSAHPSDPRAEDVAALRDVQQRHLNDLITAIHSQSSSLRARPFGSSMGEVPGHRAQPIGGRERPLRRPQTAGPLSGPVRGREWGSQRRSDTMAGRPGVPARPRSPASRRSSAIRGPAEAKKMPLSGTPAHSHRSSDRPSGAFEHGDDPRRAPTSSCCGWARCS
jgi:hypothetical protein